MNSLPVESTSASFALNILQYANALDVLAVSQNIDKGLILLGQISYGSLVRVADTVSYKEMQNVILTGEDRPSSRCQNTRMTIGDQD